jgi:hypothetical protein
MFHILCFLNSKTQKIELYEPVEALVYSFTVTSSIKIKYSISAMSHKFFLNMFI